MDRAAGGFAPISLTCCRQNSAERLGQIPAKYQLLNALRRFLRAYQRRIALCEQIELQVLRDLPLIGVSSLSYVIARNPRVDVGYPVRSGYARWRLTRATIVG